MDFTPRLGLPYIAAQQAQKQVTYNEAMKALDLLVQPAVLSRTTMSPPGSPAEGDAYLVPTGASGTWSGHDGAFAAFRDGGWDFQTPQVGWLAYVADAAEIAIRGAGAWSTLVTNGGSGVAMFGINTTADASNRLSVAAAASLFTHDGASHQIKINKAAAGDTGSVLFQTGWSGRAEFGLTGDDDFHVKVSADGSAWSDALLLEAGSGRVALPQGQVKFPATANPSADANTLDDYREGSTTPTPTPDSGAFSSATASVSYVKIGKRVLFDAHVTITAHGTAGGWINVALPFVNAGATEAAAGVRAADGVALAAMIAGGGATLRLARYDAASVAGSDTSLHVSGAYSAT